MITETSLKINWCSYNDCIKANNENLTCWSHRMWRSEKKTVWRNCVVFFLIIFPRSFQLHIVFRLVCVSSLAVANARVSLYVIFYGLWLMGIHLVWIKYGILAMLWPHPNGFWRCFGMKSKSHLLECARACAFQTLSRCHLMLFNRI